MYSLTPNQRCTSCVLSDKFPGVAYDADGICSYCREVSSDLIQGEDRRRDWMEKLERIFADAVKRDVSYHCVVALSGGKDSSYTLQLLRERYGLRCLAATVDNGYLSALALDNCRAVCDQLGVDHVLYKPATSFMRNLISESAKGGLHVAGATMRASDICNSCISLINSYMLRLANGHGISIVAGGYLGGQVPKDAVAMTIIPQALQRARVHTDAKLRQRLGSEATKYFDLGTVANTPASPITIVNPMLALQYSENEIVASIAKLGWSRPTDTGAVSSNCRLNDVGIYVHYRRYGFHPYEAEFAELVRNGFMERSEAIRRLETKQPVDELKAILDALAIERDD